MVVPSEVIISDYVNKIKVGYWFPFNIIHTGYQSWNYLLCCVEHNKFSCCPI